MSSAILCDNLTRDFGRVRAVDALTLAVPEGSIFAFLGPNGAGKTTTIHLLLGIIEPTSGSARVLGLDPAQNGHDIRRRSGALLEHPGLYERLSAEDNLRFYARIARLSREETDERIRELLTRFGLYGRRADSVGTWSRGMKQKLAIARALLHRPALVFLDEPTAGLDPESTVALRRDITALGTTVFLTTHNLGDVEKMATHVAVIRSGKLLDFGTPAELRKRAVRSHVTIRMQDREPLVADIGPDESVAPIVTRLVTEGARIEEVRRLEASLEDVFLHLVQNASPPLNVEQTLLSAPGAGRVVPGEQTGVSAPRSGADPQPIFRDILTIMRKEWRELLNASGSGSTTRINITVGAAMLLFCAGLAAIMPSDVVIHPAVLTVTLIPYIVILAAVVDSFPGERERHTLETLLASAIPDEALLLGKILASVVWSWLFVLLILAAVLIGANVKSYPVMYPRSTLLAVLIATPLALTLFSTVGVLICMKLPTVRAAQPRVTAMFMGLFILAVILGRVMPDEWRQQAKRMMLNESSRLYAFATQAAILVVLNLLLLVFAMLRFRRSRLI